MVSKTLLKIFAILSVISIALAQTKPGDELINPNLNSEDFSDEDRKFIESSSEKHGFNVEVSRLMDIIVNSLYTHKEIFIRELISNSSDACDKVRFIAIQNPEFLGDQKDCEIRVEYSKKDKTFSITDSGIGMSKGDLVKNLGTIAKSGTTSFIEAISKGQSLNFRKNIKKYSEFINFPIFLRINQTYTREEDVEVSSEGTNQTRSTNTTDDFEIKDDKPEEKSAPTKRTVDDWRWEWVKINENQPLWLKNRDDITIEEYNKFYKALTRESENNPIAYEHSYTEGEVNFKYILYLPDNKPSDMFENYYGRNSALKLYVRRVLVNEQFEELIPRYLNFVKGVVDSDDLPLNVSREQLQQHKMIKVMAKKLVRTVINMLIKLAANTEDDEEDEDEDEENKDKSETKTPVENKYNKFWTAFGKNIKLGVIEDTANRSKLAKLLR